MNWDNAFVNLILVLIIRCWLHNMCINKQFDPLFKGDIFCESALFCEITDYLMAWLPW